MTTEYQFSFDPNAVIGDLPDGSYSALITSAQVKPNRAQNGYYLQLNFQINEGEYAGTNIISRLNVDNPNKTAENVGRKQMRQICLASGREQIVTDPTQLITNVPLLITTRLQKNSNPEFGDSVQIVKYEKIGFNSAVSSGRPNWGAALEAGNANTSQPQQLGAPLGAPIGSPMGNHLSDSDIPF